MLSVLNDPKLDRMLPEPELHRTSRTQDTWPIERYYFHERTGPVA